MMNLSVPRQLPVCAACLQGKMKADPHPPVLERSTKPFELVHSDLIPLDGISFGGSKYMLPFVDDCTRFAWVYFSSSKDASTISPLIEGFINMVSTQFDTVIKCWRTDGGTGEFINSMVTQINRRYGILHQSSTSGVKQQNGVVERRVQTIKNMERSMRAGAGVLDDYRLQAESLAAAVLLTNILPSITLDNTSPYLNLYGKQPSLDFLKPWGCLVYVHLRKDHRSTTSDPRCKPAMLVGYVLGSTTIYKCLDLLTLQASNHSEVKFDEELFPGPWIQRPPGFKPSIAHRRNPPGSAVNTGSGHAVLQPLPSRTPSSWSVPFSSMNPFWMQSSHQATANIALGSPQPPAPALSGSQPVYNVGGNVVFGTCDEIHKHDSTRELVEADGILQGLESLSRPPWQIAQEIHTDHNGDPLSYSDALRQDPSNWLPAIKEELDSHKENGTWIVQETSQMPKGSKSIPGKWVFKRKPLPDGSVRYKAHLVIRGFLQRHGVDFMDTYAPTASLAAFRLLVAIAIFNGWSMRNLDIITAFLYGDIDSEVYMGVPEGMGLDPKLFVLKLRRSLYGLKQAPRIWREKIHSFLSRVGFHCCDAEPAIFTRNCDGRFVILLLFVDDIILTGTDEGIEDFVQECSREFKTRDLGNPRLFLGIQIERQGNKVILHQRNYICRILERFDAPKDPVAIPLDPKHPLVDASDSDLLNEDDALEYRASVGALMYLMICTRPDLAFTLSRLSKFCSRPGIKHAAALKRVFRYLAGTKYLGISFNRPDPLPNPLLYGYSDSDFAADINNRRSTSGFVFLLNGGPISWKSKQQSLVTTSTHDAEYVGLANASYEVIWLRKLILAILPDYTEHTMPANNLYCDNQGAIATASQPIHAISSRSKHIDVRFHVIRDAAANGLIRLEYVRTGDMTADILTKALPRETFQRHVRGLGMVGYISVVYEIFFFFSPLFFFSWLCYSPGFLHVFVPRGFCVEVFPRDCLYIEYRCSATSLVLHPGSSGR
jgi:reverse transcriptase-like protein